MKPTLISVIIAVALALFGQECNGQGKNTAIFRSTLSGITSRLHRRAVEAADGKNVVLSPFSISVSLGMALLGAKKNTQFELERFTDWRWKKDTEPKVHNNLRKMMNKITDANKGPKLDVTNGLFLDNEFEAGTIYSKALQIYYMIEQQSLDFQNQPENSTIVINKWISEETDGHLDNVIPDGVITSLTRMVLVNVINFVGTWDVAFDEKTQERNFYTNFGKESAKPADFLVKEKMPIVLYRGSEFNKRGVFFAIPYDTGDEGLGEHTTYFVIGKPNTRQDLDYMNRNLKTILNVIKPVGGNPRSWRQMKVDLKLPKFDVSQDLDVQKVLKAEGVRDLFDQSKCDLSGINDGVDNGLYVSDFLHKARVEVDAKGTKASAATVQVVSFRSIAPRVWPITVDTPFFFGIYYAKVNAFLFTGVINDPTLD